MVKVPRTLAWRFPLLILVFFVVMPLPAGIDIHGASGGDAPGPTSTGITFKITVDVEDAVTGITLVAPFGGYRAFLVDGDGATVHTWTFNRVTTGTTELLPDGTLLRGRAGANRQPDGMQIVDWDGKVLWDYTPPSPYSLHHDIQPMPNGNILVNTAVAYNGSSLVAAGRDPNHITDMLVIEPILEIKPKGANGGDIVWIWNPLDHIIQDIDPAKSNYGVVGEHPELIDINYPPDSTNEWQHSNSVAYNAELDQVMITNRNFDEFWVIDHNTTTAEAANHTGGARGMGGDLLYRWGNPGAYDRGSEADHILWGPHDAHWIAPGLPGEGNILVFNNGIRPDESYSSIEELVPPVDASGDYDLSTGAAYGPSSVTWRYTADPKNDFFAWAMGGMERLPDGNTLICGGSEGTNFEVEPDGDVVWSYKSNAAFKVARYYPPGLETVHDQVATEDVRLSLNLSSVISDLDTDADDLSIGSTSMFATVAGHLLQMVYPEGVLTETFIISVSDGIFKVDRDVLVTVVPVNDPPYLAPVPQVEATEDVPYSLDLRPYVMDPDTPLEMIRVKVASPFVTVSGLVLTLRYPDGVLSDDLSVRVSDGQLETTAKVSVSVRPVNDPPVVDPIPDQHGWEDVPWTIDLEGYVRDIDDPIGNLSVASASRYASVDGLLLTLLYPENVTRDVVRIDVTDGSDSTAAEFNVLIGPVNDPPVIEPIPPLTLREDEPHTLDVGMFVSDVDTPLGDLALRVDSPHVTVVGLTLLLLYPDGIRQDELLVEVVDGDLVSIVTLWVYVQPVNDPPALGEMPQVTVTEDVPFRLDLSPFMSDPDTHLGDLTLRVDSPHIEVDGLALVLLYPDGIVRDEVEIEVWDGSLFARATLQVTVEPVNDPPWWSALPEIAAIEDVEGGLDLDLFMNDADTPSSELVVEVVSAHGSMDGHVFRFLYPEGVLSEPVAFTLSDGEFRVVLRTTVVVQQINDPPELTLAGADPPRGREGTMFTFTVVFRDVDMGQDDPTVEVVIDGVRHACESDELDGLRYENGVVFSIGLKLGPGVHTFHFTASDGDGGKVTTEPMEVKVRDEPGVWEDGDPTFIVLGTGMVAAVLVSVIVLARRKR